jgi:UDP-N-acetylmuramyl tripeptide synthase
MKTFLCKLRLIITILICKLLVRICRIAGLGGTSLPGKIALWLNPSVLEILAKQFKIITVTGTNGKTTTTGILAEILNSSDISFISNSLGANLLSGITVTFILAVNWLGESNSTFALLEVDEGVFGKITSYFEPDIIIVTNFFKDQTDRLGGVFEVLKRVDGTIKKSHKAQLVLNADDPLCASLGQNKKNQIIYYGLSEHAYEALENQTENIIVSEIETLFCLYCGNKYDYDFCTYEHLGGFMCPNCGYKRPNSQITCLEIENMTNEFSYVNIQIQDQIQDKNIVTRINLPGLFNIYNALGAVAASNILKVTEDAIIKTLSNYKPNFGRMEEVFIDGKQVRIILVKNAAGFNQIINHLLKEKHLIKLALLINDKPGDDKDISWIESVNFEGLLEINDNINNILISGTKSLDVCKRLKYAGFHEDKISLFDKPKRLIENGLSNTVKNETIYILPTYTAMLDVKKILKKKYRLKAFWQ